MVCWRDLRPDVFVTVEVENEELFTSPLRCVSRRPVVESHAINSCPSHDDVGGFFLETATRRRYETINPNWTTEEDGLD